MLFPSQSGFRLDLVPNQCPYFSNISVFPEFLYGSQPWHGKEEIDLAAQQAQSMRSDTKNIVLGGRARESWAAWNDTGNQSEISWNLWGQELRWNDTARVCRNIQEQGALWQEPGFKLRNRKLHRLQLYYLDFQFTLDFHHSTSSSKNSNQPTIFIFKKIFRRKLV